MNPKLGIKMKHKIQFTLIISLIFLNMNLLQAVEKTKNRMNEGRNLYNLNCAECHGKYGQGTKTGPPMVHKIYNPGHHGDESFLRAVKNGVPRHHWSFGDMPPQPQVTEEMVKDIVYFVRRLQQSFGITYQPHRM